VHAEAAFVLTILVLCYALVSGLVKRLRVAPALIFVACGVFLGPSVLGWVKVGPHTEGFTVLAQSALTVILFNQASMLDLRAALRGRHLQRRLLTIGIPVTLTLGTLTAIVLLPALPIWQAVCVAVIVAPTEVALIEALVEDRRIPEQVRNALSVESGFYDGLALAVLLAALAIASEQTDHLAGRWIGFVLRTEVLSTVVGIAIGALGGILATRARNRSWMSDTWAQLATLALALVCFGVGERFHGSGFVSAFAGGLAYALTSTKRGGHPHAMQVSAAAAELLELVVFAIFGGFAVIPAFRQADWRVLVFAIAAVLAVRMVAVAVALIGTGQPARNTLLMGWFGPRGIGSLVIGLLVIESGEIAQTSLITEVTVVAVTLSLVVHGLTAPFGVRSFAKAEPMADPGRSNQAASRWH
jgi:NhaP-type Na+/H+ or K+/H+ antiporter